MSAELVDEYLAKQDAAARETLQIVRERILEIMPEAEECISYGMPGFKLKFGKKVKAFAGIAAFKNHLSYFPHSGRTSTTLADKLGDYDLIPSGLQFQRGEPLPVEVIRMLIDARIKEIEEDL
ncbi:MAG: DUF1801 domain-containing protein [Actinomycetales bacterium]|nr:DUF1801 domain-containing protein [Actinomycetales bacterium]